MVAEKIAQIVKYFFYAIFGLLVVSISFCRVSDGKNSYSYLESLLFGRSIGSVISRSFQSNAMNNLQDAADLGDRVAQHLIEHDPELINNPKLDKLRKRVAATARQAFKLSNEIPTEFLAESNSELPKYYREHFVVAMDMWADGLTNSDPALIQKGSEHYDAFLTWIQSKTDEDDFKKMK